MAYYVQGRNTTLYFTAEGLTLAQTANGPGNARLRAGQNSVVPVAFRTDASSDNAIRRWVLKLDFVAARPGVRPVGQDRTPAVISYFKGRPGESKTGLPTYSKVVYADLWPGIDLVYEGAVNRLKYTFVVRPGASPEQIRLAYRGVTAVKLNDTGELEISTPVGSFQDAKPYAYQEERDGQRREVSAAYAPGEAAGGSHEYGFAVGAYDQSRPLVLDPAMLIYAGYIGGGAGGDLTLGNDIGTGIAVDGAGNVYVAGWTQSSEATFPATVGPDLTFAGPAMAGESGDAFVAKVNAAGTALLYAGYIGGSGNEFGTGIAVDAAGHAYVIGFTNSSEATFPATVGPDLTYNGGLNDAFVAKVNAAGTALLYAGYIGGAGDDTGFGIAVDGVGDAYVTGTTSSTEATFPATVGPDLTYNGGLDDAFVAKVNAAGTALLYAGYIGGGSEDFCRAIAVDGAGNAYVIGVTQSTEATFPVTMGPDLTHNGSSDAFVAKVNAAGTALDYAGYIGGSTVEDGIGIAVDGAGNAYATGATTSTEATFPVTVGPDLTHNGGNNAFVAKVNAAGTALLYAGYIGGTGANLGRGIAVDGAGNAYVTGSTNASEATFPVTVGPDLTYNGGSSDAFVAMVNAAGTALLYAGYIGGSGHDSGNDIAVDAAGNAYVIGFTNSSEATFPATVGPDLTHNGSNDAFVAKISNVPAYSVCLLYDPAKAHKSGSTIPIKLQLCDSSGNNLSAPSITVHAIDITQTSTSISGLVEDSGNANPDNDFRFDATLGGTGGYIFNLSTYGLTTGSYNLNFTVTGDSATYAAPFQVK